MGYFGDGGTIHGTTQWPTGGDQFGHYLHGNMCECGEHISDNATRCQPCRRNREETMKRNRGKFRKRRKGMTPAAVLALTATQMSRVRAMLDVRREAE